MNEIKIPVSLKVYPLEAVYKAAYALIDRAYLFLNNYSKDKLTIFIKGKKNLTDKQLDMLAGEFKNELLNCSVRIGLAKYNHKVRELIISQALVSAIDSNLDNLEEGPQEDPYGIATPWEEKYGSESHKKKC